jgi:hypothetical protein
MTTRIKDLIPEGTAVFTGASETLRLSGIDEDINSSGRYDSLRARGRAMDRVTQMDEIRKQLASPDVIVGSVAAVTASRWKASAPRWPTGGPAPSTASSSSTQNPTPGAAPSSCSAKPSDSEPRPPRLAGQGPQVGTAVVVSRGQQGAIGAEGH